MDDFSIFVTLLNFKTFIVKPFKEEDREPIPFDFSTNVKNHRCSGVSFSKNKEFCVFSVKLVLYLRMIFKNLLRFPNCELSIDSIAKFHDHLSFKEPWYLLWCSVNDQLSLEELQKAVIRTSVHDVFDYLENFR